MYIKQTNSTSTLLRERYSDDMPNLYVIRTDYQTSGRGQAGNGWESEAGKNLLFSILLRCQSLSAGEQFSLTMLMSVTMIELLSRYLPTDRLSIKWPNDVYYGDRKVCGILVENTLMGGLVDHSIVGIGLNVNQLEFHSDAPNPVSMRQITGEIYDVAGLLDEYLKILECRLPMLSDSTLKSLYLACLYRRKGFYPYIEREVNTTPTSIALVSEHSFGSFLAEFVGVTPSGELLLRTQSGEIKSYHFKQIRYIIDL